jgi:hypothetical protein
VAAFVRWQAVAARRHVLNLEARVAQQVIEPDASPIFVGSPAEMTYADAVQKVISREVANLTADLTDDLQREIDEAGR